jgi:CheY-like chemotaxis protein
MPDRILFLDDNPARQRWAARELGIGNRLTPAVTAEDAIGYLWSTTAEGLGIEANPPFDLVHLDHDLGDETFVDSSRPDCGMEVVRWIVANRPTIGRIVVHTMNTPAGHAMVRALREAGYNAKYRSFYKMVHETGETADV